MSLFWTIYLISLIIFWIGMFILIPIIDDVSGKFLYFKFGITDETIKEKLGLTTYGDLFFFILWNLPIAVSIISSVFLVHIICLSWCFIFSKINKFMEKDLW